MNKIFIDILRYHRTKIVNVKNQLSVPARQNFTPRNCTVTSPFNPYRNALQWDTRLYGIKKKRREFKNKIQKKKKKEQNISCTETNVCISFTKKKKEEKRKNKKIRPYERFTLTSIQSIRSYILPLFYSIFHFQISKYFFLFYLNIHRDIFYATNKKNKKRRIEKRKEKRGEREAHSSENSNAHLLLGDDNLLFVVRSLAIHTGWF